MARRVSPPLALLAAGLALGAPAAAVAEEGVAFKNILGSMGIIPADKDPIRYRERAPLVLPPKSELREPVAASLATSDPAWPNDPDVASKRRKAAEQRMPVLDSEARRMNDKEARLSPRELQAGRTDRREAGGPPGPIGDRAGVVLSPTELRAMAKRDDDASNGPEPVRRTLTDPPSGMRRAAAGGSVKGSFDPIVDRERTDSSPLAFIRRQFSRDDDE